MPRILSCLLLLPVLLLAACGGTGSATSTPTASQAQLGQAVTVPGWTITINSATTAAQIGVSVPDQAGDVFLILDTTMQNTTGTTATASDTPFYCRGADGTSYNLIAAGDPSIDGPVAAGASARGQITFEVSPSVAQFTVFYSPAGAGALATWQIII